MIAQLVLTVCFGFALTQIDAVTAALAANGMADGETVWIDTVHIEGLIHTKQETILRLLPRSVPAEFTRAEVEEFERRVQNLSLFDRVQVTRDGPTVTVDVEKDYTGTDPGVYERHQREGSRRHSRSGGIQPVWYGHATRWTVQLQSTRTERGLVALATCLRAGRWAKETMGSYNVNDIRFADSASTWNRNRIGGGLEVKGPYQYGSPLRYSGAREGVPRADRRRERRSTPA